MYVPKKQLHIAEAEACHPFRSSADPPHYDKAISTPLVYSSRNSSTAFTPSCRCSAVSVTLSFTLSTGLKTITCLKHTGYLKVTVYCIQFISDNQLNLRRLSICYNFLPHSIWINVCFWETAHLPLPKPNIQTLTSRFGQNVRFGEGKVGSFPETYIDPPILILFSPLFETLPA